MHAFIEHARTFPARLAASGRSLAPLAQGQRPEALFITCSDSRVVPSLITGAGPGQLFELRTAGQIVPRYSLERPTGEAATIEFAVEVLGVAHVVVCGHSHCAAVAALARGEELTAVPALNGWLAHAAEPPPARPPSDRDLDHAVHGHVLAQLERLREYPSIRRRLEEGRITLHGWFYQVHTGLVFACRPGDDLFLPL
ncbi:carbonic anhydrase [Thermomonospora catenispora]|uniref:carbonic anhydrase n=1 Tax=Thermomonospora catenispora TaxID=2493090 RepID=UPI00111D5C1D|nr:carbonic anhydrase [Thermomonospora catenispora]TNY37118.1 carbonic anhydrase [Thermomonospora catenispora]